MASEMFGLDSYSPNEVAERVENVGVAKARLPLLSQLVLGTLAGGFIGLGAMFFTLSPATPPSASPSAESSAGVPSPSA